MCRVLISTFYWNCGHSGTVTSMTNNNQHCPWPRKEQRVSLADHCPSCLHPDRQPEDIPLTPYKVFLCNRAGLLIYKTVWLPWVPHDDKEVSVRILHEEERQLEVGIVEVEKSLEEKRQRWFEGYKLWQEEVLARLRHRSGNQVKYSLPRILTFEEFKQDIAHNGARLVQEWDWKVGEGAKLGESTRPRERRGRARSRRHARKL